MKKESENLEIYKNIILDLLDGEKWHDIQYTTGLSEERCKEIEKHYLHIRKEQNES